MTQHYLLPYFAYSHLPEHLRLVSQKFYDLAYEMAENLKAGPMLDVCLQKLLEAKDAAVRAAL